MEAGREGRKDKIDLDAEINKEKDGIKGKKTMTKN